MPSCGKILVERELLIENVIVIPNLRHLCTKFRMHVHIDAYVTYEPSTVCKNRTSLIVSLTSIGIYEILTLLDIHMKIYLPVGVR